MIVPVRKPCNACVTLYTFQDSSRFLFYRFEILCVLAPCFNRVATSSELSRACIEPIDQQLSHFILKLLLLMKYFRRYQPPNSPLARFFAMDIKLCSIHDLARKTFYAFAYGAARVPFYNNFPIEKPKCP